MLISCFVSKNNGRASLTRKFLPVRKKFPDTAQIFSSYHLVKNTPKVTGFLGTQNKPQAVSDKEVERILGRVAEQGAQKPRQLIHYEIGERVRVSDGPFQSFEGLVSEVDEERGRLKVAVMIFGRETPVDLEYAQVEKLR